MAEHTFGFRTQKNDPLRNREHLTVPS